MLGPFEFVRWVVTKPVLKVYAITRQIYYIRFWRKRLSLSHFLVASHFWLKPIGELRNFFKVVGSSLMQRRQSIVGVHVYRLLLSLQTLQLLKGMSVGSAQILKRR